MKNRQSAMQREKAVALSVQDGRDLVVEAVASAYLQIISDAARIEATKAQVATAQALYERARDQHRAGISPAIDELRAQVELKTQQQVLIAQENQRAKDKLSLARVIGLAPGQEFELSDHGAVRRHGSHDAGGGDAAGLPVAGRLSERGDAGACGGNGAAGVARRTVSDASGGWKLRRPGNDHRRLAWHLHGDGIAAIQHLRRRAESGRIWNRWTLRSSSAGMSWPI